VTADLLLVTHEHADHNGVAAIAGDPVILRRAGCPRRRRIGAPEGGPN
jgi:L-ascorbate metabolism protein UlaG (beta-lactamase superfamily)